MNTNLHLRNQDNIPLEHLQGSPVCILIDDCKHGSAIYFTFIHFLMPQRSNRNMCKVKGPTSLNHSWLVHPVKHLGTYTNDVSFIIFNYKFRYTLIYHISKNRIHNILPMVTSRLSRSKTEKKVLIIFMFYLAR